MELPFPCLQRCLRALALGDFFGRDVDSDNFAFSIAQRVPIGDPPAFFGSVRALATDLNASYRLASTHDRTDNAFDRIGQSRYTVANRASQVILDGNAAYVGKALVDLQVTAVGRKDGEADRCGVVDQLQGRPLK